VIGLRRSANGADRQRVGSIGERAATRFLKKHGFRILQRNYRCPLGEIDIVAAEKDVLVFVEVKTRRSHEYGEPLESVPAAKQRQIRRTAQHYVSRHGLDDLDARFDIVGITLGDDGRPAEIELVRSAFTL